MSNYKDNKKILDKIKQKYGCKGNILFNTSMQYIIEYGKEYLSNKEEIQKDLHAIDVKHDIAEEKGDHLFIGREFEKALLECAVEIARVDTIDIIKYIQNEWMFYDYSEINYERAIELLKYTIEFSLQDRETEFAKEDLEFIGFEDDEIEFLGYGEVFFKEDEE